MSQHSNYNRWTWLVAILLTIVLIVLWHLGFGGNQSCCNRAVSITPETIVAEASSAPTQQAFHFNANAQKIETSGDASLAPWLDRAETIKMFLASGKDFSLSGDASTAVLIGEVDTVVTKEQKGLELQQMLGGMVTIDNQLTVKALVEAAAPPVILPPPDIVKIYFETAKASLTEADMASLTMITDWLKANPNGKAKIAGYHDASGIIENNQMIAKSRAQALYDALVAAGVPTTQLELTQQENMLGDGTYKEARRAEVSAVP